jgi:uncharacterized repeat protein (TIGR01451 family)
VNGTRLTVIGGALALGTSLLVILRPGLLPFDVDWNLVAVAGVALLFQAARVIRDRHRRDLREATTPDPELGASMEPPGEDIEDALAGFLGLRRVYQQRESIREQLRSAAITVLTRHGRTDTEARDALAAGTWTDDARAAAFLGEGDDPTPPRWSRLRVLRGDESHLQRDVHHAVDVIAAAAGVTPPTSEAATDRRDGTSIHARDTGEESEASVAEDSHETGQWHGVSVVALVGIGVGIIVEQPAILMAGIVGIGFAAHARSAAFDPGDAPVSVDRVLDAERPETGEEIKVRVTVRNESDRFLADLRFVDGVPEALSVVDGSPRIGTALRSGERTSFTYVVTARRGVHPFETSRLVARDLTGAIEQVWTIDTETTMTCIPPLGTSTEPVPIREQATQQVGRVGTTSGGAGIEFHATREYQPGDPMSRVDWNHRARTGELTTIQFREERAATVVLVIDARMAAYRSPDPHDSHAVDRAVTAAGRLYSTLTDAGNRVGIAAVGSEPCWLAPGSGVDHGIEAREFLATHPALSPVPAGEQPSPTRWEDRLRKRLAPGMQVFVLSPLCDDWGRDVARRVEEHGHRTTVVSIDPTIDREPGHRLSRVAREKRISTLRSAGLPVIDWQWNETIDSALARHEERWKR